MVTEQTQLLSGERIELLAIFSNPSLRHVSANLGPHLTKAGGSAHLQLGRELKSLLRSVPSPYVFVEPAATLEDVRSAVEEHNPQVRAPPWQRALAARAAQLHSPWLHLLCQARAALTMAIL